MAAFNEEGVSTCPFGRWSSSAMVEGQLVDAGKRWGVNEGLTT